MAEAPTEVVNAEDPASQEGANPAAQFRGVGVNFKAKLIGIDDVGDSRGDKMCQDSILKLKAVVKVAGTHKQKILVNISLEGLKILDLSTGEVQHAHPVNKISFVARDLTDRRAFGYIFSAEDGKHKLFGIKTAKVAETLVLSLRDLFQVVYDLRKQELEGGGAPPQQQRQQQQAVAAAAVPIAGTQGNILGGYQPSGAAGEAKLDEMLQTMTSMDQVIKFAPTSMVGDLGGQLPGTPGTPVTPATPDLIGSEGFGANLSDISSLSSNFSLKSSRSNVDLHRESGLAVVDNSSASGGGGGGLHFKRSNSSRSGASSSGGGGGKSTRNTLQPSPSMPASLSRQSSTRSGRFHIKSSPNRPRKSNGGGGDRLMLRTSESEVVLDDDDDEDDDAFTFESPTLGGSKASSNADVHTMATTTAPTAAAADLKCAEKKESSSSLSSPQHTTSSLRVGPPPSHARARPRPKQQTPQPTPTPSTTEWVANFDAFATSTPPPSDGGEEVFDQVDPFSEFQLSEDPFSEFQLSEDPFSAELADDDDDDFFHFPPTAPPVVVTHPTSTPVSCPPPIPPRPTNLMLAASPDPSNSPQISPPSGLPPALPSLRIPTATSSYNTSRASSCRSSVNPSPTHSPPTLPPPSLPFRLDDHHVMGGGDADVITPKPTAPPSLPRRTPSSSSSKPLPSNRGSSLSDELQSLSMPAEQPPPVPGASMTNDQILNQFRGAPATGMFANMQQQQQPQQPAYQQPAYQQQQPAYQQQQQFNPMQGGMQQAPQSNPFGGNAFAPQPQMFQPQQQQLPQVPPRTGQMFQPQPPQQQQQMFGAPAAPLLSPLPPQSGMRPQQDQAQQQQQPQADPFGDILGGMGGAADPKDMFKGFEMAKLTPTSGIDNYLLNSKGVLPVDQLQQQRGGPPTAMPRNTLDQNQSLFG